MEHANPKAALNLKDVERFKSKAYRDSFLEDDVKSGIAYQIQALREKFGLNQTQFAERLGKQQPAISRWENSEYGSVTVNTLLEIAQALNVAIQIRFCDYKEILEREVSQEAMNVDTISETLEKLQSFARVLSAASTRPFPAHPLKDQPPWQITKVNTPSPQYNDLATTNSGTYIQIRSL